MGPEFYTPLVLGRGWKCPWWFFPPAVVVYKILSPKNKILGEFWFAAFLSLKMAILERHLQRPDEPKTGWFSIPGRVQERAEKTAEKTLRNAEMCNRRGCWGVPLQARFKQRLKVAYHSAEKCRQSENCRATPQAITQPLLQPFSIHPVRSAKLPNAKIDG